MREYAVKLRKYLDQNPIAYTDGDSLLEELYWCYTEANSFDNREIRTQFQAVYRSMPELSEERFDAIFGEVSTLSALLEKQAFQAGAKIGLRLAAELLE